MSLTRFSMLAACSLILCAPGESSAASGCPVVSSKNWHAWIDRFPGNGMNRVIVTGVVDMPSAGYRVRMVARGALRGRPPVQEFALEVTPPTGTSASVVTGVPFRGEMKTPFSNLRVLVSCGGKQLMYFDQVVVTD